ncbi:hypothetical protein [Lactococcus formosensis]|uniref:hypothetical protein n=1 Tax=Lactococcus formosensis TaxID=1281486 RepID=UPI00254F4FE9|nr:hypothetical protein [Lactococcus formosensis]
MKVIITMAGAGSRFRKEGYNVPKHEIIVKGRSLFQWSMLSLKDFFKEEFVFLTREGNYNREHIDSECRILGIENYSIIEIGSMTDGQASTAFYAKEIIKPDNDFIIYNIDTYIEEHVLSKDVIAQGDGHIVVFRAEGDHWSFIGLDENDKITKVTEKVRISDLATVGLYYFKSWKKFEEIYNLHLEDVKSDYKESYIVPFYQYMINDGAEITYSIIEQSVVHALGTPNEVKDFENKYE